MHRYVCIVMLWACAGDGTRGPRAAEPSAPSASVEPAPSPAPSAAASAPSTPADSTATAAQEDDDQDASYRRRHPIAEDQRDHRPSRYPLPRGALARLGGPVRHGRSSLARAGDVLVTTLSYVGVQKVDARTGEVLATLPMADLSAEASSASADGKLVAIATYHDVIVLDVAKLAVVKKIHLFDERHGSIRDVAFAHDGRLVVAGCSKQLDEVLRIFEPRTGDVVATFADVPPPKDSWDDRCVNPLAMSPDGKLLAVGLDDKARVYTLASRTRLVELRGEIAVHGLAFTPDSRRLLVASYSSPVNLFDLATGRVVRSFGYFDHSAGDTLRSVAVSPDGARVLVSTRTVRVYEAATGLEVTRFPTATGPVNDGTPLAFVGPHELVYLVQMPQMIGRFDLERLEQRGPRDHGGHDLELRGAAFVAGGSAIATAAQDSSLRRWDAATGAPQRTVDDFDGGNQVLAVAPSEELVTAGVTRGSSGRSHPGVCGLRVRDPATFAVRATVELAVPECSPRGIAITAGRAFVAFDKTVLAIDLAGPRVVATTEHEVRSGPVVLGDGSLVVAGRDGKLAILDPERLTVRKQIDEVADALAVFPRSSLVVAGTSHELIVVDVASGKRVARYTAPESVWLRSALAVSPDGSRLYIGYRPRAGGSGVAAFDRNLGPVGTLEQLHASSSDVTTLVVSADGKRIVEGNEDASALVLDATVFQRGQP